MADAFMAWEGSNSQSAADLQLILNAGLSFTRANAASKHCAPPAADEDTPNRDSTVAITMPEGTFGRTQYISSFLHQFPVTSIEMIEKLRSKRTQTLYFACVIRNAMSTTVIIRPTRKTKYEILNIRYFRLNTKPR